MMACGRRQLRISHGLLDSLAGSPMADVQKIRVGDLKAGEKKEPMVIDAAVSIRIYGYGYG